MNNELLYDYQKRVDKLFLLQLSHSNSYAFGLDLADLLYEIEKQGFVVTTAPYTYVVRNKKGEILYSKQTKKYVIKKRSAKHDVKRSKNAVPLGQGKFLFTKDGVQLQ